MGLFCAHMYITFYFLFNSVINYLVWSLYITSKKNPKRIFFIFESNLHDLPVLLSSKLTCFNIQNHAICRISILQLLIFENHSLKSLCHLSIRKQCNKSNSQV